MDIQLENATKIFGATTVINHVNMHLTSGRIYGFQGINGCGKTMLMRLIAGLIYPTSGTVSIDGRPLRGQNSFPPSMGLLIENPAFLDGYTGMENLSMLAGIRGNIGADEISRALERVGLDPTEKKKYKKYSLGMKQWLGIACAIMERPELLILDEPFLSLDEAGVQTVFEIIQQERSRGALVIMACHEYETLVGLADEIFRITAGSITKHLIKAPDGTLKEAERTQ